MFKPPKLARYLICALLLVLPFERIPSLELQLWDQSVTLRLSQIAGLGLIALSLPTIWARRRQLLSRPWILLVLFGLAAVISTALALDLKRALLTTVFIGFSAALALALSWQFEHDQLKTYGRWLWAGAALAIVFGFYQFFGDLVGLSTGLTGLKDHYTQSVFGFPRIQSTGLEPLYFANYLLLPLSLGLGYWLGKKDGLGWWVSLAALVVVVMTLSRGAYAAAAVLVAGVAGWALWRGQVRSAMKVAATAAASIAVALGLLAIGSAVDQRPDTSASSNVGKIAKQSTNTTKGVSVEERTLTRQLGVRAFKSAPAVGIGPGNFGVYAHRQEPKRFADTSMIVNNETVELLAEHGVVGFGLFLAFLGSLLWRAVKKLPTLNREARIWVLGLLATLAAIAVQYQTFSTLHITHIWVAIGLLAGLVLNGQEDVKNSN